jgi:hypothetical protein
MSFYLVTGWQHQSSDACCRWLIGVCLQGEEADLRITLSYLRHSTAASTAVNKLRKLLAKQQAANSRLTAQLSGTQQDDLRTSVSGVSFAPGHAAVLMIMIGCCQPAACQALWQHVVPQQEALLQAHGDSNGRAFRAHAQRASTGWQAASQVVADMALSLQQQCQY